MKLKEYIFRLIAVTLFISAGFVYIILCENDKNSVIIETRRNRNEENTEIITENSKELTHTGIDVSKDIDMTEQSKTGYNEKGSDKSETGNSDPSDEKTGITGIVRADPDMNTEFSEGLIDINSADKADLMNLPGIGAVKADAIIAYRNENGRFGSAEELMMVPGIKEATFMKIRELIYVNDHGS